MTSTITADHAEFRTETGHIKLGIIDNKNGKECWIYEVEGTNTVGLMARARKQAKDWGFKDVFANLSNARLALALKNHGWTLEQVILKGRT